MSSESAPPLGERLLALFEPALLMAWAASHYFRVCAEAVFQKGQILAPVLQTGRLRDEAFGRFWVEFTGTQQRQKQFDSVASESNHTDPDSNNNNDDKDNYAQPASTSSELIPPLLKTASGIVLDIGPGTGTQMPLLRSPAITAIYGPEPCHGLHAELRAKAAAEGLGSKYHVLPCGVAAEELLPALQATGTGIVPNSTSNPGPNYTKKNGTNAATSTGVFDTILCVRVLCSVPHMERTVRELYALLRPGGRILVTEHVVNPWRSAKGSLAGRIAQAIYQFLGWSWYIGDCCLDRDTETALRGAADVDGGWESVQLDRSFSWSAMPHISGTLIKKSL
ncbi:hypothetical protein NUU61_002162 [Penicillium alfredii]|uniref:Methyltransferase type 11 domain-containing protein n=1 Tax=Penicillium alfredii TaxID=1506179 RepID=A0A9W9FR22_9EURO|nr:uncharacterized protein NUU61_002162 [Penicillium alfredii]KAJ5104815.1 hypothetical protein NUU61_002162 [Penicillium alfredii]